MQAKTSWLSRLKCWLEDEERDTLIMGSREESRWSIRELQPTTMGTRALPVAFSVGSSPVAPLADARFLAHSPAQAKEYASKMLNHKLITKQTGAAGRICNAVMLAERMPPQKEYYAAILNDRARGCPVLVTSNQGGMNIEDVAKESPDAIITTPLDFDSGISSQEAEKLAEKLGFKPEARKNAGKVFEDLYKIFREKDATQIEINPLAEMQDGQVLW